MTQTLAQLITIVRNRGDARNTVRFPDAYLTAELQAAFAEGYELIVEQNSGFFDQFDNVSTVAHQAFVALPAGPPVSWIVRAVDRQDGNDFIPIPRVGIKDRLRYGTTEGRPGAHRLTARGIDLYPTPDQIYTLRVLHTPAAPILDATPREYYSSWEEYAVYGALVRLYNTQGRDPMQWSRQLALTTERIMKAAGERDSSGPEYLNLREGPGGDSWDGELDAWRRGF
jgi:hypothetical protein